MGRKAARVMMWAMAFIIIALAVWVGWSKGDWDGLMQAAVFFMYTTTVDENMGLRDRLAELRCELRDARRRADEPVPPQRPQKRGKWGWEDL